MAKCTLSQRVARLLEQGEDAGLEDHLAGCPECQRAVELAAGELRLPAVSPAGDEPSPRLLDRLRALAKEVQPEEEPPAIPGFEVLGVLGRGGSAVVYKARQMALNRVVALKVLSPEYAAHPGGLARARRGIEALAAMDHPNIVRVLHAGVHEGVYYVVQEHAEGTLGRRLEETSFRPEVTARLLRDLASGVEALHRRGYIHRDLKPANVLLSSVAQAPLLAPRTLQDKRGDLSDVPKLADFGLVRAIDDNDDLTGEGVVVGTPGAMAPEQAEGRSRLGPAVDIWALGVILYEMLTGRPLFDAESTTELLGRTAHDTPDPPSKVAAGIPPELERICLTCLRKDPRDRYQTAAALADDLDRFLADEPVTARQATFPERLARWARRHGVLFSCCTVMVVTSVALLPIVLFHTNDLRNQVEQSERTLHAIRLDMAREHLQRGDRAGAWEVLQRCPERRRDQDWQDLWQRAQPRD